MTERAIHAEKGYGQRSGLWTAERATKLERTINTGMGYGYSNGRWMMEWTMKGATIDRTGLVLLCTADIVPFNNREIGSWSGSSWWFGLRVRVVVRR